MVLDIGEAYTKAGFAGEHCPRYIGPTTFAKQNPLTRGVNTLSQSEWEAILTEFLKFLYFKKIQINPHDRRVLICENPFWPTVFKQALAASLFGLEVPGVRFLTAAALPIYTTGQESGLVVDMGYYECRCVPIVDGYPLMSSMRTCAVGMADVEARVKEDCKEAELTAEQLAEVVQQSCYVRAKDDTNVPADTKEIGFEGGKTASVPGQTRANSFDTLFGDNQESYNVAEAVVAALQKSSMDARPDIIANVVLCGGTSMAPGMAHRFLQEVDEALKATTQLGGLTGRVQLFKGAAFPAHTASFASASLVGSLEKGDADFIPKEAYTPGTPLVLPDWTTQHVRSREAEAEEEGEEEDTPEYLMF